MSAAPRSGWLLTCVLLSAGCAGAPGKGSWGAGGWPAGGTLRHAAAAAASDPATWLPLAGAAVLAVGDLDEDLSDWAADETPVFGSHASSASDDLRDLATAAYVVTALLAPADTPYDRLRGLGVGASTMLLEGGVTTGLKSLADRERPNGRNDNSFPSGHAAQASSRAALARYNLAWIDMPGWAKRTGEIGLHGIAAGAAWARVEAEKHYPTDVLVGMALGNFIARFMQTAFLEPAMPDMAGVRFEARPGGGLLTFTLPLQPR